MTNSEKALKMHEEWHGKIETCAKSHVNSREDLAIAYTPGVAQPCLEIQKDVNKSYDLTRRWNTVCCCNRRNRGTWTGRYRTGSRYACYGR